MIAASSSLESGRWETNAECYRLPDYLKDANARVLWQGSSSWMGHPIATPADVRGSALFSRFETDAMSLMIDREPLGADDITDLLFANLKTPDFVGHRYGPDSAELRETLAALDRDLARVVAALDAKVGRERYVLAITADHGMPNEPDARKGHGRHYADDVVKRIHERFDSARGRLRSTAAACASLASTSGRSRSFWRRSPSSSPRTRNTKWPGPRQSSTDGLTAWPPPLY